MGIPSREVQREAYRFAFVSAEEDCKASQLGVF